MLNIDNRTYNFSCIYCIQDDQGKLYFGQTCNYKKRVQWYEWAFREGRLHNIHLQRVYTKGHNLRIFIVEFCQREDLNKKEIFWIDIFNSYKSGYNMTAGGEDLRNLPKELRVKQGEAQKGRVSPMKGKVFTKDHRRRISEAHKGKKKPYSNTHLESIRKFHQGRQGKRRVYKKVKAINIGSGEEKIFDSIVQTAEFFGRKGHTLSTNFGDKLTITYNGYILEKIA